MSPELLIRRLVYAREAYYKKSGKSQTPEFYEEMIEKNYDNSDGIYNEWMETQMGKEKT